MLVLKVLLLIIFVIGLIIFINFINTIYEEKFEFRPFSKGMFTMQIIISACILGGMMWYDKIKGGNGDLLNPIIIIILGIIILIATIIYTYKKTNLIYGTVANFINLLILFIASYAMILFVLWCILNIIVIMTAKPVYVVNK